VAVREFTDSGGTVWRVWDVTPEHMHRVTASEDFLGDMKDGWLCFESESEKRRLVSPYPRSWIDMPIPQLEKLVSVAPVVPTRKSSTPSGESRAFAAKLDSQLKDSGQCEFMSPGGREWICRLHDRLGRAGETERVLRYTAGDIVLDVANWPAYWGKLSREEHALLILDADPPRVTPSSVAGGPRRRRED
jgi:hypothetical protein